MTEFLINTPYHKRWWLPDGKHQFNSFLYGDTLHISIIEAKQLRTKESFDISLLKPGWEALAETAQALAEKKYRKPSNLPRELQGMKRSLI